MLIKIEGLGEVCNKIIYISPQLRKKKSNCMGIFNGGRVCIRSLNSSELIILLSKSIAAVFK